MQCFFTCNLSSLLFIFKIQRRWATLFLNLDMNLNYGDFTYCSNLKWYVHTSEKYVGPARVTFCRHILYAASTPSTPLQIWWLKCPDSGKQCDTWRKWKVWTEGESRGFKGQGKKIAAVVSVACTAILFAMHITDTRLWLTIYILPFFSSPSIASYPKTDCWVIA